MRKTDWFMISNWFISDEKKINLILLLYILVYKRTLIGIEPRNPMYPMYHQWCWSNGNHIGAHCSPCVKSLMDMEFLLLVRDCVCRWQPLGSYHALREDHWRRTFNFFLMGPYNTETGNHYIYNHGRNYPKIIRSFFGLIFWLVLHYTCLDSSTINGLKLVGTCNTGDICDRLKVRWDLPLFLLRDFLGFVNLNHSVIHASRKEFDRLIDKPVVKPQNWRNKYICKIIYEFMNFRVN